MNGTSMAAPHVSGVCASVWAIAPDLTGAEVKQIVVQTADIPVPGGSAGLVDMEAAMAAASR
jgi:subtilisin family serine protease